jgi:hypothetical protein
MKRTKYGLLDTGDGVCAQLLCALVKNSKIVWTADHQKMNESRRIGYQVERNIQTQIVDGINLLIKMFLSALLKKDGHLRDLKFSSRQ